MVLPSEWAHSKLTSYRASTIPPLFSHIVGFPTLNVRAADVITPGGAFIYELITQKRDVVSTMLRTLATPTLLEGQDGIVVGVQSPGRPSWTFFTLPGARRVLGIGLPSCSVPDCAGKNKPDIKFTWKTWGDRGSVLVVKCTDCQLRSEPCRAPPESKVEGRPDLLQWRWPLTKQDWGWFPIDPKNTEASPLRILKF